MKLNIEIDRIMKLPNLQEWLVSGATHYMGGTPEQAVDFMRSEMIKSSKVLQSIGVKPE